MQNDRLIVLITPSGAGNAWRAALAAHAERMAWTVSDAGPGGPPEGVTGLFFAHQHTAMSSAQGHAVVLVDTTAGGVADPSLPANTDELNVRSIALVEADNAARAGATVLNAARYRHEFPGLGWVERPEGELYRIHPAAAESPLAIFDEMPLPPSVGVNWGPQWFAYAAETPGLEAPLWVDMTGRMRPLVYGPYIQLPAGRWRVDVRLSVDPERAHAPLLFEWGSGVNFCRVMAEIRRRGTYELQLDRVWLEPEVAQLRIWNAHPVFEGQVRFEGCCVTSVAADDQSQPTPLDHIVQLGEI